MWFYQQPAKPEMIQALIAEVPEFYFLAAVEEKQQPEPGSVSPQQQLHQSSGNKKKTKKKQPDINDANVSIWNLGANTRSLHFTDAHAQKEAGESFQLPSSRGKKTWTLGSVITEGRLPLLGPGLIKPRGFDGRGERITDVSGGRMTTCLTPGLRSFGSWQTDLKENSSLKWVTYRVDTALPCKKKGTKEQMRQPISIV